MAKQDRTTEKQNKGISFTHADDFHSIYANNSTFQASNWDLKIIFGELDQSKGPNDVTRKVAVTIPWPQAKVLHYFLTLNLMAHETANQRIMVAPGIIAPLPDEPPSGVDPEAFD